MSIVLNLFVHYSIFSYGSGNVRSAVRALERVGARVALTADEEAVTGADGLVVPRLL